MGGDNASRRRHNDDSLGYAVNHRLLWDGTETTYLEAHLDDHTLHTAIEIGRTFIAVQNKRQQLKLRRVSKDQMPQENKQKPMTLIDAVQERNKQLDKGTYLPTILSVHGGYVVVEGRLARRTPNGAVEAKPTVDG